MSGTCERNGAWSKAISDASSKATSLINGLHDCRVWRAKISWVSHFGEACYPAIQLMVNDGDATIRLTLRVHAFSLILAMGQSRHATINADGIGQRVGVFR